MANDAPCASCKVKAPRAIDKNAFVRHPTLRRHLPGPFASRRSEQRQVSGISQCHRCHTTFSRDVNACCNIMAVGIAAAIRTCDIMECRPAYLDSPRCRQYEPDADMRGDGGVKPQTAVPATRKRRPGAPAARTSQTRRRRRNGTRSGAAVAAGAEGSGEEATLTTPAGVDPPSMCTPAAGTTQHGVAGSAARVAAPGRRRARGKRSRGEEGAQAAGRAEKRQRHRYRAGKGAT